MINTIIFDFFDVIHSDPAKRWLSSIGVSREGAVANAFNQVDKGELTVDELFIRLSKVTGEKLENIQQAFSKKDLIDHEVVNLIRKLKLNYKIGLLSNSPGEYIRPILEKNNLVSLFDEIVISGDVGHIKPSPDIFTIALEKLQTNPENAIFIDDHEHYVAAATNLGINGLVFSTHNKLVNDLKKLDITF